MEYDESSLRPLNRRVLINGQDYRKLEFGAFSDSARTSQHQSEVFQTAHALDKITPIPPNGEICSVRN